MEQVAANNTLVVNKRQPEEVRALMRVRARVMQEKSLG